jgi:hypothetical protein
MAFLIVFGAGVLILGLVYVILGIQRRRRARGLRRDWRPVAATVVAARVSSREYADTVQHGPEVSLKKHEPVVTFTYQAGGETYTSTQFGLFPRTRALAEAQAVCDYYLEAGAVEARYNPASPQQAVLTRPRTIPRAPDPTAARRRKRTLRPQWRSLYNYPTLIIGIVLTVIGVAQIALGIVLLVT